MANSEHVEKLSHGVEAWNEWRRCSDEFPDLSGSNLRDYLVKRMQLASDASLPLSHIDLSHADLVASNLYNSNLYGANLFGAKLDKANLSHSNLQDANLDTAILRKTKLFNSNLVGANLTGARPWNAILYLPPHSSLAVKPSTRLEDDTLPTHLDDISTLLTAFKLLRDHYAKCPNEKTQLFFRGESRNCRSWKLRPAVMRQTKQAEESEMLFDLLSRRPEDFERMNTALSQWVLAQHHGLKTRLLDVTRNPLVGLFNACESQIPENMRSDGRIHVFAVPRVYQVSTDEFRPIKSFISDTVSVIANFAKLSLDEQGVILGYKGVSRKPHDPRVITYDRAMRRLYHFIRQEKPNFEERIDIRDLFSVFVVEPQRMFERIRAQDGAFLVSAFHQRFEERKLREFDNGIPYYHHYTLIIPSDRKSELLDQLQMMTVSRETLYPGIEEATDAINRQYLD